MGQGIGGRWGVANLGTTVQIVAKMPLGGATRVLAIAPRVADGWTAVLPCTIVDEASAILFFVKCTDVSAALWGCQTDLTVYRDQRPDQLVASFCELAHCRLLAPPRAGPRAHVGRPLLTD